MNCKRHLDPFLGLVISAGAFICLASSLLLPFSLLNVRFLVLVSITLCISSHITIRLPRFTSQISVSDTFIFLTLLLYGGEAAILLAAAESMISSIRFSKRISTILFNGGVSACSTLVTVVSLRILFGDLHSLVQGDYSVRFVLAICLMAFIQYAVNSILVTVAGAMRLEQSIWQTWVNNYLWASLTFFSGAVAAGVIAKYISLIGFSAILISTPIIAIVFLTYRSYLKNVQASVSQAEQAQRHVEELSHYISEQARIREQFTQLEKLSALGELASGVAHDFNNTLTGILGRAQLLQRTDDIEKIRRGLAIIIKVAEDGARTVKRIQDFARQRRDQDFESLAVDQLLFDVSEITRPRWKDRAEAANIHINLELQIDSNATIMGDDSELREVLVNMVFNAVDAMPDGGKLTLATKQSDGMVEISVGDTGTGMSDLVRSKIFDPFFTTKGKAGLGLGLAVSYGIISRHDGLVDLESELGKGTTFRMRFPIAKSKSTPRLLEGGDGSLKTRRLEHPIPLLLQPKMDQSRILIVDDEEQVRELLRDILESENCQVVLAEGGTEALSVFEFGKFDAVFTDIGMPGMSGWELARALRERDKQIPLAVITGWGDAVASQEQRDAKVDWVVTKPFSADRVAGLVREVSFRRSQRTQVTTFTAAA